MTKQEFYKKIEEVKEEFHKKLDELYDIEIEAEQPKRWKPEENDIYWTAYDNGICGDSTWENDKVDKWRYLIGNCFKTFEEAEEYKKQIEYTARYKNYIEEHSEPINWKDFEQEKYFAEFNCEFDKIDVDSCCYLKSQGTICASSEQIIWDAINEIGEDNFKKYVLGVK